MFNLISYSQTIDRIEVVGVIVSSSNDVEAVTVFNKTTNKGTITNNKGEFNLKVGLNDVIEISALQFRLVSIVVDKTIIISKQLKIQLIDQVNQLDAITLSSGLSGDITKDILDAKKRNPITVGMSNILVDFEYNDDKAFDNLVVNNHLESVINPDARNYQPDLVKIIGFFTKSKKDLKLKKNVFAERAYEKPKYLLDVYSLEEIKNQFKIPEDKFQEFLGFIENKGLKIELLEPENEFLLLEFLVVQSKLFLKETDAKN